MLVDKCICNLLPEVDPRARTGTVVASFEEEGVP